ncbi:MAG TPA: protein kinase [Pyrinomonadaceae bacterium]|nr:protein kinase [Pyrinomonadaceae bacterium]
MIAPNTLLQNRYLVLKQIGQGGMGAVYIATDQRFGSTVALKETFFTEAGLRKAFEREARLLNHLRHPALPRVSDHFTEEEGQFLVMEYIAGDDLAEKLKERGGAFTLSEVLNWADQLLDALDYLHTQEPSVIHRDIKPQNLKLTPRNAIVLLDFGLAKGATAVQTKVTATGSVFGYSRNYAPLEQIQGAGTDPRSDIYSLGATLYHLITGVTPPDALARATAVLNGQTDPLLPANEVHEQVTPAVAEVLSKAMAQNAGQRPQTAAAMREWMREAARQGHTTAASAARETSAASGSSSNVYEQDTQLMFAAAPSTKTGETAAAGEETGTVRGSAGSTNLNSTPAVSADASTGSSESVVTKVAKAEQTTLKNHSRTRAFAIAASAVALLAVAGLVYSFMRNPQPASSVQQSVESAPVLPQTSNTANQGDQPSTETVNQLPSAPTTSKQETPPAATHDKPVKVIIKSNPAPKSGQTVVVGDDEEPPDAPEPGEMPHPGRPPRKIIRPGDPEFDESMRAAIEAKRAGEEARRAAREQRRLILQQQRRQIMERARQRQQQRQP